MTALRNFLFGTGPLPFSRNHRRLQKRRVLLDIAAEHLFVHIESDIPEARKAGRAAADWHTSAMVEAMLSDPRLKIELVES